MPGVLSPPAGRRGRRARWSTTLVAACLLRSTWRDCSPKLCSHGPLWMWRVDRRLLAPPWPDADVDERASDRRYRAKTGTRGGSKPH